MTRTGADGKQTQMNSVFLRGSQILFIIFPQMLKNAPMFKRIKIWRKYKGHPPQIGGAGIGPRGQAAAIIRKGASQTCFNSFLFYFSHLISSFFFFFLQLNKDRVELDQLVHLKVLGEVFHLIYSYLCLCLVFPPYFCFCPKPGISKNKFLGYWFLLLRYMRV